MAEAGFNRLKGNVDRIERAISTAKRSLNTNKKFAEGVDYSEDLQASMQNYKKPLISNLTQQVLLLKRLKQIWKTL